ncbi:MAG: hypothetical protein U9N40_02190 [Euryarchaeota archaeon]|nr:hypothetical protein [Euryarchaeota archaeon]
MTAVSLSGNTHRQIIMEIQLHDRMTGEPAKIITMHKKLKRRDYFRCKIPFI